MLDKQAECLRAFSLDKKDKCWLEASRPWSVLDPAGREDSEEMRLCKARNKCTGGLWEHFALNKSQDKFLKDNSSLIVLIILCIPVLFQIAAGHFLAFSMI